MCVLHVCVFGPAAKSQTKQKQQTTKQHRSLAFSRLALSERVQGGSRDLREPGQEPHRRDPGPRMCLMFLSFALLLFVGLFENENKKQKTNDLLELFSLLKINVFEFVWASSSLEP